jgi:hypothetical protein
MSWKAVEPPGSPSNVPGAPERQIPWRSERNSDRRRRVRAKTIVPIAGDRGFESRFLQRGVWYELDFSGVQAGTIVHPDGALAQVEGAALWGASLALHEGSEFCETPGEGQWDPRGTAYSYYGKGCGAPAGSGT